MTSKRSESIAVGFATDVGRMRERNEDSYAVFLPYPGEHNPSRLDALLVVADGMGGEQAGEQASRLAAETVRRWLASGDYLHWPEAGPDGSLEKVLRRVFQVANREVLALAAGDPTARGAGTTLVVAAIAGGRLNLAHVGDSRCYRLRSGQIEQLTQDHSWVERQVREGLLTEAEARRHPQRNILTKSIGDATPPEPDVRIEAVEPGDRFLLCTDGLTGGVAAADILAQANAAPDPQALASALIDEANRVDGSDNITAVVGQFQPMIEGDTHPELGAAPAAPPRSSRLRAVGLALAGVIVGLAAGLGAGLWFGRPEPPPPTLESRAAALLDEARQAMRVQTVGQARRQLEEVIGMYREAPQAREAERLLRQLEPQPGTRPEAPEQPGGPAAEAASPTPASAPIVAGEPAPPRATPVNQEDAPPARTD